jgi:capsular exopolysaccharide synthesis family protein
LDKLDAASVSAQRGQSVDFRTFVRTLAARWKIAVPAVLVCVVGAGFITAVQTKQYQASATILMSFSGQTSLNDAEYAAQASQQRLSSYAQIAGGPMVAQRAVDQLQIPMSADELAAKTKVVYTPDSTVLQLTLTDTDPTRVAALAAAMADQFTAVVPTLGIGARPATPVPGGTAPRPDVEGQQTFQLSQAKTETPTPGEQPANPLGSSLPLATGLVVERPSVPDEPVQPVPERNMVMGLLAGLLLGIAAAMIREAADHTVRDAATLGQLTDLPTLAELPGRRGQTPRFGTDALFDDSMRTLRTRLLRAIGPDVSRLLVTEPFGGEGTTTTALNLGRCFTELGERVLLIEGDPRRSVIAQVMGVKSPLGLADVLADRKVAAEAVYGTAVSNLFVLASSKSRRDAMLPSSADLPEVLAQLSAGYDRIVVDAPAALATAETCLLAGAVQVTILVVRSGRTTADEVKDALHALRSAGANVVGTVLTDARVSRRTRAAARNYRAKLSGAV